MRNENKQFTDEKNTLDQNLIINKDSIRDSEDALKKLSEGGNVADGDNLIENAANKCSSNIQNEQIKIQQIEAELKRNARIQSNNDEELARKINDS